MRLKLLIVLTPLFVTLAQAQIVTAEPSLGMAEQQYRSAQEDWLHNDPGLASELLSGNPDQIHQRIHQAAALRDDMMAKKAVYLDLVVKHFMDMRSKLTADGKSELPVPELRKGLEEEQSQTLADQERLEALMHDLPQGDEYSLVMRELDAERTELITLQNTIALRIRSIDQVDRVQTASQQVEAKDPLDQKLGSIQQVWEGERDKTAREREKWAALYSEMDKEVDKGRATAPAKGAPAKPPAKPAAKDPPPQGEIQPAPKSPDFSGAWSYQSRPGAWTGYGEPERAVLRLGGSSEHFSGTYVARIPGKNDVRTLILLLTGREVSPGVARIEWSSTEPAAHGQMLLQLGGDGRMLVERTTSDDTYVPRGMEVLLPQ